ncbi:N-acetyltransferase family protein [Haladaptatus sp. NG-SE-30]
MSEHRRFPDEPAGPFPEPPLSFTDREDREIEIRPYEDDDEEPLVSMYVDFDPADRAQGIPPATEPRVRDWVDTLTEGLNVVAWHGDHVAGHATLVPDGNDSSELAIFVHQDYQRAGIGSHLIRTLLGYGREEGIEKVWLTVERWNRAAVNLYRNVGFETADAESFELEMVLRL